MRVELETETGIGGPNRGDREGAEPIERPGVTPSRPGGTRASARRLPRPYSWCAPCPSQPLPAPALGQRLSTPDEARMTPFPARALRRFVISGAALTWLLVLSAHAQAPAAAAPTDLAASRARLADEGYVTPAPEIAKLVTAPRQQNALLSLESPDHRHYLRAIGDG